VEAIILCVVALVLFLVLFFVVDFITRNKAAQEKKQIKPKESEVKKAEEPKVLTSEEYRNEMNANNLANDIEKLINNDSKHDSVKQKHESASKRSLLVNRGRMRDYYQKKHAERVSKYRDYGVEEMGSIDDVDYSPNRMTIGDIDLTEDEARKLIALAEVLKRKDS